MGCFITMGMLCAKPWKNATIMKTWEGVINFGFNNFLENALAPHTLNSFDPTEHFTISGPSNSSMNISQLHKIQWQMDFEALKMFGQVTTKMMLV